MGWRQRAPQPISLRRDVQAPLATCLISSAQKMERLLPPQTKTLPTADAAASTVSKSFQQGRTRYGFFFLFYRQESLLKGRISPWGAAGREGFTHCRVVLQLLKFKSVHRGTQVTVKPASCAFPGELSN